MVQSFDSHNSKFDNLSQDFDEFCKTCSLVYETEQGWVAIAQPLNMRYSFRSDPPLATKEEAWNQACRVLAISFLSQICENNLGIIISNNEDIITCSSIDVKQSFGFLAGIDWRDFISFNFLPPQFDKKKFTKLERRKYLQKIQEVIQDFPVNELDVQGSRYLILQIASIQKQKLCRTNATS